MSYNTCFYFLVYESYKKTGYNQLINHVNPHSELTELNNNRIKKTMAATMCRCHLCPIYLDNLDSYIEKLNVLLEKTLLAFNLKN